MSKRLGGIIGYKYKTSSWHLNGFLDGSNIGSTIYCRGEAHRDTVNFTCVFFLAICGCLHKRYSDKCIVNVERVT